MTSRMASFADGSHAMRYSDPAETAAEINRRLTTALIEAGRSPLGMPGTVDTFKAMLDKAGLALVLK